MQVEETSHKRPHIYESTYMKCHEGQICGNKVDCGCLGL